MNFGIKGEVFSFIFLISEKKRNNFKRYMNTTNVEQSEELIKLGLPVNTSDCYWLDLGGKWVLVPHHEPEIVNGLRDTYSRKYIEAWTLDALIEILGEFNCSYDKVLDTWNCTSWGVFLSRKSRLEGAIALVKDRLKKKINDRDR